MRVFAIDDSNPDYDIVNRIYQNVGTGTHTGIEAHFQPRYRRALAALG